MGKYFLNYSRCDLVPTSINSVLSEKSCKHRRTNDISGSVLEKDKSVYIISKQMVAVSMPTNHPTHPEV